MALAAGAVLALSGAASWLLPDPWTPPPQTCNADFTESFACGPEPAETSSALSPSPPPPVRGASTCDAELDGCPASSAPASSSPSATSSSSTASSAATPPTEGPGRPRDRTGVPPTPPSDPGNDSGGSRNESGSWLHQSWRWVLWSLWSWCGPFCWRIGAAVRAAGYLMVSSITLLVLYGLFVIWTCLLRPARNLVWFVCRYLGGRRRTFRPRHPIGAGPSHRGPGLHCTCRRKCAGEVWTTANLMTSSSVMMALMYARLRHGPLTGRTNRKGFICPYEGVLSCSNRSLRRRLETLPMQVHLCANSPCNDPGAAAVHIACSASVCRTTEYDLQEMAGRRPEGLGAEHGEWRSGLAIHWRPLVGSAAHVRSLWHPATDQTSTQIRRPTPTLKTSLARPGPPGGARSFGVGGRLERKTMFGCCQGKADLPPARRR